MADPAGPRPADLLERDFTAFGTDLDDHRVREGVSQHPQRACLPPSTPSTPASLIRGTNNSPISPSSRRLARTYRQTCRSDTSAPCSSTSRCRIRRAV
jgi:hypothetical protein